MLCRSRCFNSLSRLIMLSLAIMMVVGCSRTKPRKHWWEFWRPKATASTPVYSPDTQILPPPPDVLGAGGPGGSTTGLPADSTLPPPPDPSMIPEPPSKRQEATDVKELNVIHFDYDSTDLSAEARGMLDQNAAWLQSRPTYEISIEGHCDERGTAEYNMNLGMRRAKVVRDYLVGKGVEAKRLYTNSYGEERPLDPSMGEDAFAKNRRVQFLVY